MLAVKEWAKNKPYIIALFAPQITPIVRDLHLDFKQLKSRRFGKRQFRLTALPPWFALYRSHRKGIQHLKNIYAAVFGHEFINAVDSLVKVVRDQIQANKDHVTTDTASPEKVGDLRQILKELLDASFEDLEEEFSNAPVDHDTQTAMKQLIDDNPLDSSFFMFVTLPCWLLYRTSPTKLYRRARSGDFDALERLLRLDPLMLHDPRIGIKIAEFRFNHVMPKYRKLMATPFKHPKGGIDRKNLILSMVGFISAFSQVTTKPLTARDIFELVAAIDEDTHDNLLDDLSKDPDALARALQPDRNQWRKLLQPDKKM